MFGKLASRFSNLAGAARSAGVAEAAKFALFRLHEEAWDRLLNVRTSGFASARSLGYDDPDLIDYAPSPYNAVRHCLSGLQIRAGHDSFLDYGAGMGRVIVLAARLPFSRVIGIDLSPIMVEMAERNLQRARGGRAPGEVHLADARAYDVPHDVTVIHFYHPFQGATLAATIERIKESLRASPRTITVFFGRSREFERLVAGQEWVRRVELRRFYPDVDYGVYRCRTPD